MPHCARHEKISVLQARGQSHKATFSLIKDTQKALDLGNGLEAHIERINSNVGRLYFVATNNMPKHIVVTEPNADRHSDLYAHGHKSP